MKYDFFDFRCFFKDWKSPIITRGQLKKVAGEVINVKTLRNLDARGEGIQGIFRISPKKIAYPVENVISWLEKRAGKANKNEQ